MNRVASQFDQIPVTLVIAIAYATLAFLCGMFDGGSDAAERFLDLLIHYGRLTPSLAAAGEGWRLFAYAFLHGHWLHLALNLFALLQFGPALELSLGSLRFLGLYAAGALGGGVAVCLWNHPGQPVVGGSGALFGMMGAMVAMNMRSGRYVIAFLEHDGGRRMVSMIAVNLLIGLWLPFISNTGHVGGLLGGFVLTFFWLVPPRTGVDRTMAVQRLVILLLVLSWTGYCLRPVARPDWLVHQAGEAADPAEQTALWRAAERAQRG